jgi:hypothetical protein
MFRWLIVVVLALVLMSGLTAWLRRFGFGRLPGDFEFRAFGREWQLPISIAHFQYVGAQHDRGAGGALHLAPSMNQKPKRKRRTTR